MTAAFLSSHTYLFVFLLPFFSFKSSFFSLFVLFFFSSPPRIPSVHPLCVAGDLLRCAAGEGKGEKASPAGRARAGEAESRINRQEKKLIFVFLQTSWKEAPTPYCSIVGLACCCDSQFNTKIIHRPLVVACVVVRSKAMF